MKKSRAKMLGDFLEDAGWVVWEDGGGKSCSKCGAGFHNTHAKYCSDCGKKLVESVSESEMEKFLEKAIAHALGENN